MIFIVGNSRSGTTMLGRVLGLNSEVHTFGELHFFEHMIGAKAFLSQQAQSEDQAIAMLEQLLTAARLGFFAKVTLGEFSLDAHKILALSATSDAACLYKEFLNFETQRAGKTISCEQTPRYLFFVDEILQIYPEALVINMVRDPRDVLLSQKYKWRRRFLGATNIPLKEALRSWANYHPFIISKLWSSCVLKGADLSKDSRVMTLGFEELLANPEQTVQGLCEFLGIPFENSMLMVPQVGSSSGTDYAEKKGIDSSRANSWEGNGLGKTEISIVEWVAKNEMKRLGYSLSGKGRFHLLMLPSIALLIAKLMLAVPMNLSRTKNLSETLRRRLFPRKVA